MTCTCLEASQCVVQRIRERFSGRQSHASFEDYIHICLSQQQQTHTGKKIQWNNLQEQILKDHPAWISSSTMMSSTPYYLACFCSHVTVLSQISGISKLLKKYGFFWRKWEISSNTLSSCFISVFSSCTLQSKQKPSIPTINTFLQLNIYVLTLK